MTCPKCHSEAAADALFCPRCGAQLPGPARGEVPSISHPLTARPADPDIGSIGAQPTARPAGALRRWKTGEKVLERYRILGELGQGGMGVVYKCFDEVGGIEVALKALPPDLSHNTVEMEEVRENFQLVSRLAHPQIATVRTLERDGATGDYYLILELAEGVDLRRWRKQRGGKARLEEVLPILRQVAEALDYAHSRRIIHRDIKPANVMAGPDGAVKVLDFGLAAQIQTSLSRVSQVKYGTSGTGPYMAPEQWRGEYQDGASDQYALAILTYELLAGRLPFESSDPVVLKHAVLDNTPNTIADLPAGAWAALARGLAKERTERYGSCAEFVEALEGKAEGRRQKAEGRRQKAENGASPFRTPRSPFRTPLAGGVVVLLLLGLAGWQWGWKPWQAAQHRKKAAANLSAANQQKVTKLRGEIADALAGDDLKTAGAKLLALEEVAGAGGAKDLRAQYQSKAGERDVTQRYAEASVANERAAKLERGQGFGVMLDQLKVSWVAAEEAKKNRNWGLALSGYEEVLKKGRELEQLEEQRQGALQARREMAAARQTAEELKAAEDANELWKAAQGKQEAAEALLAEGTVGEAATVFGSAQQAYAQAQKRAEEVRGCRKAKADYEALLKDTNTVALLERHGGTNWAAVKDLAANAEAAKETAAGAKHYQDAAKAWPAAVAAAKVGEKAEKIASALHAANGAAKGGQWGEVAKLASEVITLDPDNAQAVKLADQAKKHLGPECATREKPWTNSLGMKFVPVAGTEVLFGVWDVRVRDYAAYAQANSGVDGSWRNPGFQQEDTHPVVNVSWDDAKAFCAWLTRKEQTEGKIGSSQSYRLPTDAEWSVAVGLPSESGSTPSDKDAKIRDVYPWGSGWPPPSGAGNYDQSLKVDSYGYTSPVGSFNANRYGLYDMGGNVWQWCEDWYDTDQKYRVLRGASWLNYDPGALLSSLRYINTPGNRSLYIGFRCVLVAGSSP